MSIVVGTTDNFEQEVLQAKGLVLVDFWATWCGPCQMIAPVLEAIAAERDDITVCKVNVDEYMDLAQKYKVAYIPFLVLFKNGEIVEKITGMQSKNDILEILDKHKR